MKNLNKVLLNVCVLLLLSAASSSAQTTFGNEWLPTVAGSKLIKLKTWNSRLYYVTKGLLDSAGLPSTVNGSELQLWHNGVQEAMFVSTNGTLGSSDYIEFYAKPADGLLDAELYDAGAHQNPNINLMHDTTYYFIAYVPGSTGNLRYTVGTNVISSPPAKEVYLWDTLRINIRGPFSNGIDHNSNPTVQFFSSRFESGEGYARTPVTNIADSTNLTLAQAYRAVGAPPVTVESILSGHNFTQHNVRLFLADVQVGDSSFANYNTKFVKSTIPIASVPASNAMEYKFQPYNSSLQDKVSLAFVGVRYARLFNVSGKTFDYFELDAKPSTYYMEFTNFANGGVAPRLYDLTNKIMYIGDIATSGIIKYQLPSTPSKTQYFLCADNLTAKVQPIAEPMDIVDITSATVEGDFVMLYSPAIYKDATTDYLTQYKDYRQSAAGGSRKVALIDAQQIYNQFGYGNNFHAAAIQRYLKYIKQNWTTKPPVDLLVVGKGLQYNSYRGVAAAPSSVNFNNMMPSFGIPGSDILLADITKDGVPDFNVGRLSVYNMQDLGNYLNKLIEYEARGKQLGNALIDSSLWKKQVLHIAGGKNISETTSITNALVRQQNVIGAEMVGAKTTMVVKNSTDPQYEINSELVDSLINGGVGLIQFFGHSAPDLFEYALRHPSYYNNNNGKYNFFVANGCDAGDFFYYAASRALTEDFIALPNKGSIAFIGASTSGYIGHLDPYTDTLYEELSHTSVQDPIGKQMRTVVDKFMSTGGTSSFRRIHLETIQLNGDPSVHYLYSNKPDYALESKYIRVSPQAINTTLDS
ncbi:MAG: hypothetical protein RL660_1602, partial [Bacteroidota bacterium]